MCMVVTAVILGTNPLFNQAYCVCVCVCVWCVCVAVNWSVVVVGTNHLLGLV